MLDKRTMQMLQLLVQSHHYLSVKELMEHFSISRRTLYYDIHKINDWLKEAGLPQVQYIYAKGYYLDESSRQAAARIIGEKKPNGYALRSGERQVYLLLYVLLANKRITTHECMEKTGVSRNTILNDLKKVKEEVEKHGLSLSYSYANGYEITGDELTIRNVLSHYVHSLLHDGQELLLQDLHEDDTDVPIPDIILQWLNDCEKHLQVQFAEDTTKSLSYLFTYYVKRIMGGNAIAFPQRQIKRIVETRHYQVIQTLERVLPLQLPQDEKCYLATLLLSAKVNEFGQSAETNEIPALKQAIADMVDLFEMRACVVFDQRVQLERNLYIHLQPAYYRFLYDMDVTNPLKEVIQRQYRDIYELTKKSISPLEQLVGKSISDDEIAYITVHFGGWMRRQGITATTLRRVLLVCANGVGTSRILVQQLDGLFSNIDLLGPITLRQYEHFQEDVDLVVSTTKIANPRHRIILVNPILTDRDKVQLLNEMEAVSHSAPSHITAQTIVDIVKKYAVVEKEDQLAEEIRQVLHQQKQIKRERKPMLDELLQEECIQLKDSVSDWKEAIRLAAEPLLKSQSITEAYVQAMIANVEENGPYIVIAPKVALPHARPEQGVNRIGMSLLRLKQPVSFSETQVREAQLIIVLAAVDNETHLQALAQLSMMLSEEDNIDRIIGAHDKETILHYISMYSNNRGNEA
ncbi:BglG family transcription antiterminator [Brevibacillus sp. LEMMJ03]|jgi:mannitol operon transcriptional antiterminator|uniref:BglG family transcription antiterminator n=1 Tax=unclassified Brevibacillus TaxID=2684853 RepID=UPI0007ED282E|nr:MULTISPECIES: BglG family transcription antiterminator [unclassified Brevibacillus]TRY24036.1 BglG family transcription antiterminator [Brevibacillus sp. LEMMJ03]UYZ13750.1 BglG family transcription antiterminator [Brevibacillus sp. WF146]